MLRVVNLTVFILSLIMPIIAAKSAAAEILGPTLIITEIKVRTDTTNLLDYDEFIELYNASDQSVDLANYNLEYYNATNPSISQQPVQKPLFDYLLGAHTQLVLAKQPIQIANSKQSPFSSLSDSGGRLRLVTSEGQVVDEIAWTNTQSLATAVGSYPAVVYQCNSSTILCNSNRSQSISRAKDTDEKYILSNPSWQLTVPSPLSSELIAYPTPTPDPDQQPTGPPSEVPAPTPDPITCEGMVISELFPNPAGADTGHEFIELHNITNDVIDLKGCALQTSSSIKKYELPELTVNPGVYVVFADSATGLTMPNTSGGTVWLLSPTEELSTVTYPGSIDDDASWATVDGLWQITYSPTPGAANITMPIKPCPAGETRNPDTDRCQAPVVAALAVAAPCKVGQERNPDTNRCRAIAATISNVIPCKEGQERNPETNRCRSIASIDGPSPCPEGQERNPDTNRCRKSTAPAGSTLGTVTDVKAQTVNSHPKWWLAIVAVLLAVGYALYEWRKDFTQFIRNIKLKIIK